MSSTTTPIVKPLLPPEIEELHASVVAAGQETYTDPATGYMVMSGLYHTYVIIQKGKIGEGTIFVGLFMACFWTYFALPTHTTHAPPYDRRRGYCCGNVCRHCPYNSMNVGKKKVDWLMADGTKYTAKKAAALTRLAKGDEEGGESPGKKEKDEDEDDNNDGGAGSDGSGSSSSSGTGGSCSSSGSRTIAAEATKAFVKMTTATEITTTSLPNGGSAQILPGELVA